MSLSTERLLRSWDDRLNALVDQLSISGYGVMKDFLDLIEVEELRNSFFVHQENSAFKAAGIGTAHDHQVDRSIRGDRIKWIDPETASLPTKKYLEKLESLMLFLNRTCYLGLKDYEVHFAWYPPGTHYERHRDTLKINDHRVISVVTYLNLEWTPEQGGCLRLYDEQTFNDSTTERIVDIAPQAGTLVLFDSKVIEHEVLTSFANRYSITGWLLDKPQKLTFL